MLILHGPFLIPTISDSVIRSLVTQRFIQILSDEPYDYDQHDYIIVLEPGDSIALLETEICNGQLKPDTFLSSLSIKYTLKFQRRLVA